MLKSSFIILTTVLLASCSSPASAEKETVQEVFVEEITPSLALDVLEATPESYLNAIRNRADGIEATMYSSGASFSVFDPNSAFAFCSQIALLAPKVNTKNQIGHIMFLEKGENILLSGVYDNGTDVFIKIEDKENGKVYYNLLTGKARDLFTNVQIQQKAE